MSISRNSSLLIGQSDGIYSLLAYKDGCVVENITSELDGLRVIVKDENSLLVKEYRYPTESNYGVIVISGRTATIKIDKADTSGKTAGALNAMIVPIIDDLDFSDLNYNPDVVIQEFDKLINAF
jgi:hypothetical protein